MMTFKYDASNYRQECAFKYSRNMNFDLIFRYSGGIFYCTGYELSLLSDDYL